RTRATLHGEGRHGLTETQHGGVQRLLIGIAGAIGDALTIQPQRELIVFIGTEFQRIHALRNQTLGDKADRLGISKGTRQQQLFPVCGKKAETEAAVALTETGKTSKLASLLLDWSGGYRLAAKITQPDRFS